MSNHHLPPSWADKFLEWFCSEDLLEEIQGDLHEAYHHRVQELGRSKANRWYVKNVFQFFDPYAFEKYSRAKQFLPMFSNYYKIAIRNILHRKGFTAINMLGLTVGISAVMLIGLFLKNELTYDQSTPDHERVFRVMNNFRDQIYTPMYFIDYNQSSLETQLRLINHMKQYEEIEEACHFVPSASSVGNQENFFVEADGKKFVGDNILYTNTGKAFQSIFPQKFLMGNPESAFSKFNQIVLTEKLAKKWFGENWQSKDLVGKNLVIRNQNFELGGVIADVPDNVHYDFDWIIHQDSIPGWGAYTYFKLKPESSVESVITQLNSDINLVYPGYTDDPLRKEIRALALADIHFTRDTLYELKPVANRTYLTTLGIVGIIILLIILTNYTNLSIAMYADRQKELGVRKVMGAQARDISFQLLAEAIILALLCFPLCLILLWFTLPSFYEVMELNWNKSILFHGNTLLSLFCLLLFTGILSGIYPAVAYGQRSMLHLFSQKMNRISGSRYFNFRNSLVTFQFVMMVGLLSITFFIYQQMQYISNTNLGYDKEGIVYFGIDGVEKYTALKKELLNLPEVEAVGGNGLPASEMYNQLTYKMEGTDVILADGTVEYFDLGTIQALNLKCDACKLLEQGKDRIFVINQTAAKKLAKIKGVRPEELIGQTLINEPEFENEQYGFGIPRVIDGIVEDFKFFSLKYPSQSLLLSIRPEPTYTYNMMVRANTKNWNSTIQKIKTAYSKVAIP